MGCTMFLQQKLNPPPPDPMQARMFQFMPIVFTFMLANFPAGLVIYWSWNNLLSVAQQWLIMRRTRLAQAAAGAHLIDGMHRCRRRAGASRRARAGGRAAAVRRGLPLLLRGPAAGPVAAAARPEVAFAGRSNVGKSSLLNALTGRRALARVSAHPGAPGSSTSSISAAG